MKKISLWKTGAHVGGVFELFGALKEFSESFLFGWTKRGAPQEEGYY